MEQTLIQLKKLEEFRIKLETGEKQAGSIDWVVRMCQAIIAKDNFENRNEWTNIINSEK